MDENERDLELFLDTLKLSPDYREFFRKRNVTSLDDLQQVVALTNYHATRDLDDFARKLADEQENLALCGFKTPISLIEQRKIEIMIEKLGKDYPSPKRVDFEDGSYYLGYFRGTEQHGRGMMKYPKGLYDGQWDLGKRQGYGTYKFHSGNTFEGMFINDNFRHGTFTFTNGNIYEGFMSGGKKHGKGVMFYADTDTLFDGDWRDGLKHGHGRCECEGNVYVGDYRHDKSHGRGIFRWADGSEYDGDFKNGLRAGKGLMRLANGDMYKGDFENDAYHGHGQFKAASGDSFFGEFKKGLKCGKGEWLGANGDRYFGDWFEDLFHGQGTYTYRNGDSYIGSYHSGLRDGDGTFHSPYENDDKSIRGSWKSDQLLRNYNPAPVNKFRP